ncbi:protein FAM178B isoform X6 [Canis lupus familiaris]|uniref:protein FAM178B isoform X6 n=1 Tax=Canis lupus familiaris TaxID=9615 RepID=UPI000BAA1F73|nr:protein FAM178B isoform X6 [Canis lupus familiaris]XP_025320590.1 protein FAM178B isoform X6 [Canis lupus dingo]XP_038407034.1 protein FAM178B isoform X6 [Canis lupus familiaris]XP_038536319.1 protein FAM178B isoform X6 [Canis lupus familiaris]|eukprot:XP_005626109.2 protein FAM178B isoform X6 [Canis lupus familiaris]
MKPDKEERECWEMGTFVHRSEEVRQVSLGRAFHTGNSKGQRPWGGQSSLRLEEKQKPLQLEQRTKDGVVEVEVRQLSSLSQLLTLMKPSSLRQYLGSETLPPCREQQPKASAELDHKVCYLCYSLLTLAGVVVSCQDITPDQWGDLQLLCLQLDRHVSTHIRESPQAMHWTRLKDLAAQTYIRWQELLAHCQPQAQYFNPWKDNSLRLLAEAGSEQGSRNRRKQRTEARGGPV